jgi:hypothetical protein
MLRLSGKISELSDSQLFRHLLRSVDTSSWQICNFPWNIRTAATVRCQGGKQAAADLDSCSGSPAAGPTTPAGALTGRNGPTMRRV